MRGGGGNHSHFKLGMVLRLGSYTSLTKFRSDSYLLPVLRLSLLVFCGLRYVSNISCRTFLRNHALQPLQTWYGASAKGSICRLPNSGPPVIYFLFYDLVYFPTKHGNVTSFRGTLLGYTKWVVTHKLSCFQRVCMAKSYDRTQNFDL